MDIAGVNCGRKLPGDIGEGEDCGIVQCGGGLWRGLGLGYGRWATFGELCTVGAGLGGGGSGVGGLK